MVECSSIEATKVCSNLNDQHQFRLNKINAVKDYFIANIKERELMSERYSKCINSFNYFEKSIIVSSATFGSISTASFATVARLPVGIASASFSLVSVLVQYLQKL